MLAVKAKPAKVTPYEVTSANPTSCLEDASPAPRNATAKPSLSQRTQEKALPLPAINPDLQTRSEPSNPLRVAERSIPVPAEKAEASRAFLFSAVRLTGLVSAAGSRVSSKAVPGRQCTRAAADRQHGSRTGWKQTSHTSLLLSRLLPSERGFKMESELVHDISGWKLQPQLTLRHSPKYIPDKPWKASSPRPLGTEQSKGVGGALFEGRVGKKPVKTWCIRKGVRASVWGGLQE